MSARHPPMHGHPVEQPYLRKSLRWEVWRRFEELEMSAHRAHPQEYFAHEKHHPPPRTPLGP